MIFAWSEEGVNKLVKACTALSKFCSPDLGLYASFESPTMMRDLSFSVVVTQSCNASYRSNSLVCCASEICQSVAPIQSGPRKGPYPASSIPIRYAMWRITCEQRRRRKYIELLLYEKTKNKPVLIRTIL